MYINKHIQFVVYLSAYASKGNVYKEVLEDMIHCDLVEERFYFVSTKKLLTTLMLWAIQDKSRVAQTGDCAMQ